MSKQVATTETQKIRTPDGTIVFYKDGKMHNWEGPAFIPEGNIKKAEYYIHGIRYSKDEWLEHLRDFNGLPWYKSSGGKVSERD